MDNIADPNITFDKDGVSSYYHDYQKVAAKELKAYFAEILPDYDQDRVYVSDMKKVLQWYNILQGFGLVDFENGSAALFIRIDKCKAPSISTIMKIDL